MNIQEAIDEWDNLGNSRRYEIFMKIVHEMIWRNDPESDAIYNFLQEHADLEAEDFFGTEGLIV